MKYLVLFERYYRPSIDARTRLDNLAKELRIKHHGGLKFFDELDDYIKDSRNEDITLELVRGTSKEWIVTSGEFGDKLYKMWKDGKFRCRGVVVFNGKITTKGESVKSWYPEDFDINNKNFVFIDDSYFSGTTKSKIGEYLEKLNSGIKKVLVIYDGSKVKTDMVKSFYRYHK